MRPRDCQGRNRVLTPAPPNPDQAISTGNTCNLKADWDSHCGSACAFSGTRKVGVQPERARDRHRRNQAQTLAPPNPECAISTGNAYKLKVDWDLHRCCASGTRKGGVQPERARDRHWRNQVAWTPALPNPDRAISTGNAHKMKQTGTYTAIAPLQLGKLGYSPRGPGTATGGIKPKHWPRQTLTEPLALAMPIS